MAFPNSGAVPLFSLPSEELYALDGQAHQLDSNLVYPWMYQEPPNAQHLSPCPSIPMQEMVGMPSPLSRSYHSSQFHQVHLSPPVERIDPNLLHDGGLLAPPDQVPQASYDAIARHFQEQPWSASNPRTARASGHRNPPTQAPAKHGIYRDVCPSSEPSDSAYYSQSQTANSVLSNGSECCTQQDVPALQVERLDVGPTSTKDHPMVRADVNARSQITSCSKKPGKSSKQIPCPHPGCLEISKCRSDFKKHVLRHSKPFTCDEPDCKRGGKGFTTTNDLERHKKSVHRIGLDAGSYQCASPYCKNPHKVWPRLDNFKQHIDRMHGDEDHEDLIKRSEFQPKDPAHNPDSMTVASANTSFDVTGMDRSLSSNHTIDDTRAVYMVADQESPPWVSFDQNSQDFVPTVQPMPNFQSKPATRKSNGRSRELGGRMNSRRKKAPPGPAQHIPKRSLPQPVSAASVSQSNQTLAFSNAPQTKAEQQRAALQKLSQAVSSPSASVDLESFLLNVLHQATGSAAWDSTLSRKPGQDQNSNGMGEFTKSDALHAVQAISNLIQQRPGALNRVRRRVTQGLVSNAKVCPFVKCGFAVARDCDLRKHMKRHEKPYGCTYPKCHKRFGAKSDYKRHENSQHFQQEAWRCSQLSDAGTPCGAHFFRIVQFDAHLRNHHKGLSPEEMEVLLVSNRIGKNCQVRFWCGFCNAIVELQNQRNAAWDERFDHIARHFEKEKRCIDDWICVEENKPKKELAKGMDSLVFEDEEDGDATGDADEDAPLPPPCDPPAHAQSGSRKRKASSDFFAAQLLQRPRMETVVVNRYCVGVFPACCWQTRWLTCTVWLRIFVWLL